MINGVIVGKMVSASAIQSFKRLMSNDHQVVVLPQCGNDH